MYRTEKCCLRPSILWFARRLGGRRRASETGENRGQFGSTDKPIALAIGAGGDTEMDRFLVSRSASPSAAHPPSLSEEFALPWLALIVSGGL
jgi:hypothetical protein